MQGIVRAAVAWLDVNEDGIAVIAACWRQRGCNWRCPGVEIPGHGERDGAVKHCRVWESRATDAMAARSGWLQGKTIRKAGAAANARSATPNQVQSTSSTIFAGGIKDASGRTTEYFVCSSSAVSSLLTSCAVYGRPVSSLQKRQVSQSKIAPASEFLLSQNVCLAPPPWLLLEAESAPHRCESCIDRLFTLGPAPCPICSKVLRKLAFAPQTFEDLAVEKEIAIRRRIAKE